MGMSKRCRSPDATLLDGASGSEEKIAPLGQADIRCFFPTTRSAGRMAGKLLRRHSGETDDTPIPEPLLKLPGQVDIRRFSAPSAAEEAALAMGLSLGIESDEESEDVQIVRNIEQREHDEAFILSIAPHCEAAMKRLQLRNQEEAALAMGLSFGELENFLEDDEMTGIALDSMPEEMLWAEVAAEDERAKQEAHQRAAEGMGLSLTMGLNICYDSESGCCPDFSELQELEEAWSVAEFQADAEAAAAMGLPLQLGVAEFEDQGSEHFEDDNVAAEIQFLDASFLSEEMAAEAMGLSLAMGDEPSTKKARLFSEFTQVLPATPPKRLLTMKTSDVSPLLETKRRRMAPESLVVHDKQSRQQPLTADMEVPEVEAR